MTDPMPDLLTARSLPLAKVLSRMIQRRSDPGMGRVLINALRAAVLAAMACLSSAGAGLAFDLSLPGEAVLTREVVDEENTYFLPVGPYANGTLPTQELEGRVIRQAWRLEGANRSTLSLVNLVRAQLEGQGYSFLLDCTAPECGGFDFRFATEVLPGPDMFVDIFDYRFLSVRHEDMPEAQHVSALVSESGGLIYLQLIVVGADETGPILVEPQASDNVAQPQASVFPIDRLLSDGRLVLRDLEFATGSATLTNRTYPSLQALAAFLQSDPVRRVALVGHTDNVGALDENITLSRERATAVLNRLVDVLNVSPEQVEADGVGYLAPLLANTTDAGREANRRVEAVLLKAP